MVSNTKNGWGTTVVVLLLLMQLITSMVICTRLPKPKSTPVEVPVIKNPDSLKNSLDELTNDLE